MTTVILDAIVILALLVIAGFEITTRIDVDERHESTTGQLATIRTALRQAGIPIPDDVPVEQPVQAPRPTPYARGEARHRAGKEGA